MLQQQNKGPRDRLRVITPQRTIAVEFMVIDRGQIGAEAQRRPTYLRATRQIRVKMMRGMIVFMRPRFGSSNAQAAKTSDQPRPSAGVVRDGYSLGGPRPMPASFSVASD